MIPDKRNAGVAPDPALTASVPDGDAHQAGAILRHFRKSAETKIWPQPRTLHFAPANASEVARDESSDNAAALQSAQHPANAGANLSSEDRRGSTVDGLRVLNYFGHGLANRRGLHTGSRHHSHKNVAVEHSSHGHAFGGGFDADGSSDGVHQSLPVVCSGAAD